MQRTLAHRAPAQLCRALIPFVVLCSLLMTGVPRMAAAAGPELSSAVADAMAGRDRLRVLVALTADPAGDALDAAQRSRALAARAGDLLRTLPASSQLLEQFPQQSTLLLDLEPSAVRQLLFDPNVAHLQPDLPEPPQLSRSTAQIAAPTLWNLGVDGSGQLLAVLDTGVDGNHPFLSGRVSAELCFSTTYDAYRASSICPGGAAFAAGPGTAADCRSWSYCGHGTHVAGIIAGRPLTVTVDGVSRRLSGVAPGARLVAVQVYSRIDDQALCGGKPAPCVLTFPSDQVRALQYLADNYTQYPIAAANLSLGSGRFSGDCDSDARKAPIDALRTSGAAVIVASGNNGYSAALSAPACISSAIAVGAVNGSTIASFTNRAAGLDLLAPGSAVISSYRGGWNALSGTSMAAPHAAGAWALIRSIEPTASVSRTLQILQSAGVPLGGWRRLSLSAVPTLLLALPATPTARLDLDGRLSLDWPAVTAPAVTALAVEQLIDGVWQPVAVLPAMATQYTVPAPLPCATATEWRLTAQHSDLPALARAGESLTVTRPALQLSAADTVAGGLLEAALCGAAPAEPATLAVNGVTVGTVQADADGSARFLIAPAADAVPGWYELRWRTQRLRVGYSLSAVVPFSGLPAADLSLPLLTVPAQVPPRALVLYLPFVTR